MNTPRPIISTYQDDVLAQHDGVALAALIAQKEISATEAVSAAIERAKKANPILHAIVSKDYSAAQQRAQQPAIGPFAGVPSFIKDTDDVSGLPTLFGSRAAVNKAATNSSEFVRLYENMGFLTLGKSALPEFGLTATTEPLLHNATCNPWNTGYSCGGSSGGSAALVAAGVVPIAHANDGGGSTRIPASCCGLVGLKPSRGRLPSSSGADKLPINIVAQGIVSRSVRDTAHFYAWAEKFYPVPSLPPVGVIDSPSKQRLKIACITQIDPTTPIANDVVSTLRETSQLCESLGHQVEEINYPFSADIFEDFMLYWGMLAFSVKHFGRQFTGHRLQKEQLEPFTHSLSKYFGKNIHKFPFAVRRMRQFATAYEQFFSHYDLLLTPTTGHASPVIGHLHIEQGLDEKYQLLKEYVPFTCLQNIAGGPALSLPMGLSPETLLPIGLQFAAPLGAERRLLQIAFELEQAKPWPLLLP